MANLTGVDVTAKLSADGTSVLTEITSHLNNVDLESALNMIEDSALGDGESTFLAGLAGANAPANGFWNSTTATLYEDLIGNRTSVTRSIALGFGSGSFYEGAVYVENVRVSGSVNDAVTFSADHRFTGAITKTSVAP